MALPDKVGLAQDANFGHHLEKEVLESVGLDDLEAEPAFSEKLRQPEVQVELPLVARGIPGIGDKKLS